MGPLLRKCAVGGGGRIAAREMAQPVNLEFLKELKWVSIVPWSFDFA